MTAKKQIKSSKIDHSAWNQFLEAEKFITDFSKKLQKRSYSIINRIIKEFNITLEDDFILDFNPFRDPVTYTLVLKSKWNDMSIIWDGKILDLVNEFPHRWLFEDFEEELIKGKKAFEDKEKQIQEDAKFKEVEYKKRQRRLKRSAMSKLSEEERKALGLN